MENICSAVAVGAFFFVPLQTENIVSRERVAFSPQVELRPTAY
jgi:hypothetical protein